MFSFPLFVAVLASLAYFDEAKVVRSIETPYVEASTGACGVTRYGTGGDRIVGGHEARKHGHPWLVSLWLEYAPYQIDSHMCGGTLIHPQYVLTAAHCTKEVGGPEFENPKLWKALVAAHDFNDIQLPAKFIRISKIVTNEYSVLTREKDIAIWKLEEPVNVDFDGWTVNTLCLPPPDSKLDLTTLKCTAAGFGLLQQDGTAATVLQEVALPVISQDKCQSYYPVKYWYPKQIFNSNICAGFEEGGKDACQGDSGGPFTCIDPVTGRPFLAGIVSWGHGCANANAPGVYTNPSYFRSWIEETIKQMEKN